MYSIYLSIFKVIVLYRYSIGNLYSSVGENHTMYPRKFFLTNITMCVPYLGKFAIITIKTFHTLRVPLSPLFLNFRLILRQFHITFVSIDFRSVRVQYSGRFPFQFQQEVQFWLSLFVLGFSCCDIFCCVLGSLIVVFQYFIIMRESLSEW